MDDLRRRRNTEWLRNPRALRGAAVGMGAGALIAAIHALACIRYNADQVVCGTAINILMLGVPGFLSGALFLSSGSTPQLPKEQLIPYTPMLIAALLVPLTWYVLYRTPFGLRLRSVGENPAAASAIKTVRHLTSLPPKGGVPSRSGTPPLGGSRPGLADSFNRTRSCLTS